MNLDFASALKQFASARTCGLKSREQQRVLMNAAKRFYVMQHAATGGHAAGGNNHLGVAIRR
jgi:hypothetical protein